MYKVKTTPKHPYVLVDCDSGESSGPYKRLANCAAAAKALGWTDYEIHDPVGKCVAYKLAGDSALREA